MPIKRVKPELKWKVLSRTTIFFAVLFIISVGAGWGIAGVADFVNVVNNLDSMEPGSEDESLPGSLPERINVLVIGSDNRPGETKARSDVLMVASFDQKTGRVAVVSIPRDTRVQIPGYGYNKVNAAYAFGGAKLSRQVVESLLGVEIPYYVATDFNGFKDIIDTLGGVTIDVEQRMYYPEEGINLHAWPAAAAERRRCPGVCALPPPAPGRYRPGREPEKILDGLWLTRCSPLRRSPNCLSCCRKSKTACKPILRGGNCWNWLEWEPSLTQPKWW
jgi:LCP family protein required for cell wall assembly